MLVRKLLVLSDGDEAFKLLRLFVVGSDLMIIFSSLNQLGVLPCLPSLCLICGQESILEKLSLKS